MALCLLKRWYTSKDITLWWQKPWFCCIYGHRTWCWCCNYGAVSSTLVYDVTFYRCITSAEVGSTLGSDRVVGVVNSTVFDSGTSNLGSFTGGVVWTGGLGASGGGVQCCKASATFS